MTTNPALPPLIRALKVIAGVPPFQNTPAGEKLHEEIIKLRDILHSEAQPSATKPDPWAHVRRAHEVHGMKVETFENEKWRGISFPSFYDYVEYRLTPSQRCPPSYLKELCGGMEPHRLDWTVGMLEDGERPLCKREPIHPEDFGIRPKDAFGLNKWVRVGGEGKVIADDDWKKNGWFVKTRRPAPLPQPEQKDLPTEEEVQLAIKTDPVLQNVADLVDVMFPPQPEPSQEKVERHERLLKAADEARARVSKMSQEERAELTKKAMEYMRGAKPTPPVAGSAGSEKWVPRFKIGQSVRRHYPWTFEGIVASILENSHSYGVKSNGGVTTIFYEDQLKPVPDPPEPGSATSFEEWLRQKQEQEHWYLHTSIIPSLKEAFVAGGAAQAAIAFAYSSLLAQKDAELASMTRSRDTYAKGFSDQNRLHGEVAHQADELETKLKAAESRAEVTGKELEERLKQSQRYYDELVEAQRQRNQFKNQFEEYKRLSDQLTGEVDSLREKLATAERERDEATAKATELKDAIYRSGYGIAYSSAGPSDTRIGVRPEVEEQERKHELHLIHENADLKKQLAASGSGWLPIESAPKDGTWILVTGMGPSFEFCHDIQKSRWRAYGEGSQAHELWKQGKGPEGGFWISNSRSTGTYNPTHWMPLPPSPVKEGGQ